MWYDWTVTGSKNFTSVHHKSFCIASENRTQFSGMEITSTSCCPKMSFWFTDMSKIECSFPCRVRGKGNLFLSSFYWIFLWGNERNTPRTNKFQNTLFCRYTGTPIPTKVKYNLHYHRSTHLFSYGLMPIKKHTINFKINKSKHINQDKWWVLSKSW